jgi:hypothetical protein
MRIGVPMPQDGHNQDEPPGSFGDPRTLILLVQATNLKEQHRHAYTPSRVSPTTI